MKKNALFIILILSLGIAFPCTLSAQLHFTVNTLASTSAYDDPNTEENEMQDGICADENGNCSLLAAVIEASAMEQSVVVDFSVAGQINLQYPGQPPPSAIGLSPGSKILGSNQQITINFVGSGFLGMDSANVVSNIKMNNVTIFMARDYNTIEGCDITGYAAYPLPVIQSSGSHNMIGGSSASKRNVIKSGSAASAGIVVALAQGQTDVSILNNYIGTNTAGTSAAPNGIGIQVIGETGEGNCHIENNVISGNLYDGLQFIFSDNNTIKDNYIGTDKNGTAALGNNGSGIVLEHSQSNIIEHNIISGNNVDGITIYSSTTDTMARDAKLNVIKNNLIGTKKDTSALGNGQNGIKLWGQVNQTTIGSPLNADTDSNVIANNGAAGIHLKIGNGGISKNTFRKNRIYDNTSLGIKLDANTNSNIQPPHLDSLKKGIDNVLHLYGSGCTAGAIVDIYKVAADPSGAGEGKEWLLKDTADANGNFDKVIDEIGCNDITATQTNTQGSTSAFATNFKSYPSSTGMTADCNGPFFAGVSYSVTYTLHINWAGIPDNGRVVTFYLNGSQETVGNLSGDVATVTYDMAQAINGTNTVTWKIESCSGQSPSEPGFTFCATDVPSWLPTPTAVGCGEYERQLTFPQNAIAPALEQIPPDTRVFVDGALGFAGLPEATTTLHIPGSSDPLTTTLHFTIGGDGVSLSVTGTVDCDLTCGNVTGHGNVTVSANIQKTFSLGWNFAPYLPSCTGVLGVPPLEQVCQAVHGVASAVNVGATVGGTLSLATTVSVAPLQFDNATGSATIYIRPFVNFLTFHGSGNGQLTFSADIPSFDVNTPNASVEFDVSESITGWSDHFGPYTYPGATPSKISLPLADLMKGMEFIPEGKKLAFQDSAIVSIAPNDAAPVFAFGTAGKAAAAWSAKHSGDPRPSGDIAVKLFNGTSWGSTIMLNSDIQVDGNPAITFDQANHVLVAWERNNSPTLPPSDSVYASSNYLRGFTIAYAILDASNGTVIQQDTFGLPLQFDSKPKLMTGKDGNTLLMWQQTLGSSYFGDYSDSLYFHSRWWNGSAWSGEQVSAGQANIIDWEPAVHNQDTAQVAMIRDMNDDFSSSADWEVFTLPLSGSGWGASARITNDSDLDFGVHATYLPDGRPAMAWYSDTSVVGIFGNLAQTPRQWLTKAHQIGLEFLNGTLKATQDSLVLVWTQGGKVQYSAASISDEVWQKQEFVNFTLDVQQYPTMSIDSQGKLRIGYLQAPFKADSAVLSDTASIRLATVALHYTSLQPEFTPSSSGISFGTLNTGESATDSIVITNSGVATMYIASAVSSSDQFTVTPDTATILPSGSRTFYITFAPTTSGDKAANIVFIHNGESSPDIIMVNGTAIGSGTSTIAMNSKWNLVSLPREVSNDSVQVLFPTASSQAFRFDQVGGYQLSQRISKGNGYWVKFASAQSVGISGIERTRDTITVKAGWNLIGSLTFPVAVGTIMQQPSGIVLSNFFGYENGYTTTDTLAPGKGYWVKVSQDGIIILQSAGR